MMHEKDLIFIMLNIVQTNTFHELLCMTKQALSAVCDYYPIHVYMGYETSEAMYILC